ncbi:hypothetical protein QM312_37010, partial [Burkholderia cenocepacia]|uniref:hypothetical protein n=1 Tax=Burkholderia cenocepacia TaxID=95486 RepID=UPI0024B7707B
TTADNRLIAVDPDVARTPALDAHLLGLDVAHGEVASGEAMFRDGMIVFRGRLGSTGWTIAYALSWADVAAAIGVRATSGSTAMSRLSAVVMKNTPATLRPGSHDSRYSGAYSVTSTANGRPSSRASAAIRMRR